MSAGLYYLENFRHVLETLCERYADLLAQDERCFADTFFSLPTESSALLVRMITRQGTLFRNSRLAYEEIGCTWRAAAPLIEAGFLDPQPALAWEDLARLATRTELSAAFELPATLRRGRKPQILDHLRTTQDAAQALTGWLRHVGDCVYRLAVAGLCDRLRIVFFGNFRQDWSEFVLADLGIHRYERVAVDAGARAFARREEIDQFAALYHCRELLHADVPPDEVLAAMPPALSGCAWIEARRVRLLLFTAHRFERAQQPSQALQIYLACEEPRARIRAIRLLDKLDRSTEAWELLSSLDRGLPDESVRQEIERIRPRLGRKLGITVERATQAAGWNTFQIQLLRGREGESVERLAAAYLATPEAPALFVENALLNSLLGLLCWEAVFAPLPGAFFHEFQAAPADLTAPDFCVRRARELADCLGRLESNEYRACILSAFAAKVGIASPFVAWGVLTPQLLTLALDCIPAAHLRKYFERILADIAANRSGLPDLIQFYPSERRYRLIEVKGPGDRLQHNQLRWLRYCVTNGMDVAVCKVSWQEALP